MAYIATNTIRDALADWVRIFKIHGDIWAEEVITYDSPELLDALNDLLVLTAARVVLIVPGQERYEGQAAPGIPILKYRYSSFTVILAIRDVDGLPAASANSTRISEIDEITQVKDYFIAGLTASGSVLTGTGLYPISGGPQDIRDQENPDRRLWRAWLARLETPAGAEEYDNATF